MKQTTTLSKKQFLKEYGRFLSSYPRNDDSEIDAENSNIEVVGDDIVINVSYKPRVYDYKGPIGNVQVAGATYDYEQRLAAEREKVKVVIKEAVREVLSEDKAEEKEAA